MVRDEENRSFRPASCCNVEVMKGAAGERRHGFSSTERTVNDAEASRAANAWAVSESRRTTSPRALSDPSSAKSLPVANRMPSSVARVAPNSTGSLSPVKRPARSQ